MSRLTYFMWIDSYDTDISPEEEMMIYISENCKLPTNEDLEKLEQEVWGNE